MENKEIYIDDVDVSWCEFYNKDDKTCREVNGKYGTDICEFDKCENYNCYYKQLKRKEQECEELKKQVCGLRPELKYIIDKTCSKYNIEAKYYHEKIVEIINNLDKLSKTLTKIKGIAEPYRMIIKKICGNCKKYNGYYAYCYKDINYYKDTSSETNACEEFTYLDELVPNILANNILQKISEVVE